MYSVVIAFGLASLMLCMGMVIRAKIPFFRHMLMPASVIGGIIGFIIMNVLLTRFNLGGVTIKDFSNIVDVFFVMSFISIGLTGGNKKKTKSKEKIKGKKSSGAVRGAIGMALIWCILYAVQPLIGIGVTAVTGKALGMDSMYGILVPFAFCQGPGQASTYGKLFEYTYGYKNAEMVALTYAVIGFIVAFGIGVPVARYGLKKGIAKNKSKINTSVERGYFTPEEQREPLGKTTFHSANIETFAAHFAIMGVTYLLALGMAAVVKMIPGLGPTFAAMLFMWGMFAAYIVKWVMNKLKIGYLINNAFQSRITGFFSDYLVVSSFMAIQVGVIGKWIVPIIIIGVLDAVVTFAISLYFGQRLGSDHDFERVLGVYGTSTGTTPSGLSLVRMVDPKLQTSTGAELGVMNMGMMFSTPTMLFITFAGLHYISLPIACAGIGATILIYLFLLKIFGVWRKPTFTLVKGRISEGDDNGAEEEFLKGYLHDLNINDVSEVESLIGNSLQ
ncbi:MAG: sodium/glutamate symporter [Lachnospira sp.]